MLSMILIVGMGSLAAQQQDTTAQQREARLRRTDSLAQRDMRMRMDSMGNKKTTMPKVSKTSRDTFPSKGKVTTRDTFSSKGKVTNSQDTFPSKGRVTSKDGKMSQYGDKAMMPNMNEWPEASRLAVEEITAKYGQPDAITENELVWMDKGVWKKICITKKETKHSFPIEHTDMLQTTVMYRVPADKMDELGTFDGSVTFDRTQGTLSARCDTEANNFLALNLAYDIIKSKLSVYQARTAYGNIVKQKMNGQNPAYMQKLNFTPQYNTPDPDKNTTGLTKQDVMKGINKTAKQQ